MSQQDPLQIRDRRSYPFCIVETAVLMDERLSTYDKMIYVVLCSFASARSRECFPSVGAIAKRASCCERQVRRSLGVLTEYRYVECGYVKGRATTYSILDLPQPPGGEASHAGGHPVPGTPAPCAGGGGTVCRHNNNALIIINNNPPSEGTAEPSPSLTDFEPDEPNEQDAPDAESLPVSEAPRAMKQTATYLLLRTGREGLSEAEISDLRKLNATHCPAVVQKEIDIAVDRFRRLRRDPKTLTFTYLVESLRYRKPTRPLGGKGRDKPADYSDLIV